jgi:hypothetical protein
VDVVDGDPLVSTMIWQCNWVIKRSGCCSGRKCQEGQVDSLVEAGVVVATVGRSCPHKRFNLLLCKYYCPLNIIMISSVGDKFWTEEESVKEAPRLAFSWLRCFPKQHINCSG